MYATRPKPGESEDDLLKLQEEFFKKKAENTITPSAKLVSDKSNKQNVKKTQEQQNVTQKQQNVTQKQQNLTQKQQNVTQEQSVKMEEESSPQEPPYDPQEQVEDTFEDIPKNAKLGNIVENFVPERTAASLFVSKKSPMGFPRAKRRDPSLKPGGGSIFASNMKKLKVDTRIEPPQGPITIGSLKIQEKIDPSAVASTSQESSSSDKNLSSNTSSDIHSPNINSSDINSSDKPKEEYLPKQSYILEGQEKHELHQENISKMCEMTQQQILEEREALLETMDPAIVAFLKARRHNTPHVVEKVPSMLEQIKAGEDLKLEDLETPMEILTQPESEKWLNFDAVESGKLAWMKNFEIPKLDKDTPYEARFDFDGNVLPYVDGDISEKNRSLYHHGEESGRPGYTLQELFQLCRSSVTQQKIVALNTIANVLALDSLGIYEGIIELPIEQIFFVLRFCLDDNTPSVLNSSVKAIRNLFYSQVDETCLDALLGFGLGITQPGLSVSPEEVEDDPTENDQQLAEKNLVKCLIRSDILVRIRYIINTVKPPLETVVYCLEILTRLARDSRFIVMRLYKFEGLLESVVRNFVCANFKADLSGEKGVLTEKGVAEKGWIGKGGSEKGWTEKGPTEIERGNRVPLPEAFRFLRILSVKYVGFARDLVNKHGIMEGIAGCLSNIHVSTNTHGLKLQIQALYLWSVLVNYDLCLDYFRALEPVLIQLFNHHVCNTDLTFSTSYVIQAHVSALLRLISDGYKKQAYIFPPEILEMAFIKWTSQFTGLSDYTCGKLQIISSVSSCLATFLSYRQTQQPPQNFNVPKVEVCFENLINSQAFQKVTENIKSGSNILSKLKDRKASPNLLGVEATIWEASDHVIPILQTKSCIPFLAALSEFITVSENPKIKLLFLKHKNLSKYIMLLKKCLKFNLVENWFTQIETKLIMNIMKIATAVQGKIDMNFFYESTVQCMTLFTQEQKSDLEYIMRSIVFNIRFFPNELLLANLTIASEVDALKSTLNSLDDILEVYSQVLGVKSIGLDPKTSAQTLGKSASGLKSSGLKSSGLKSSGLKPAPGLKPTPTHFCVNVPVKTIAPIDWIYSPIILLYSEQQQNKSTLPEHRQIFLVQICLRWIYLYEHHFTTLASMINPTDRFCRLACVFLGKDDLFFDKEIHCLLELCLKCILTNDEEKINFDKPIQGLNNFQDFYVQLLEQYQGVSYGDVLFGNFIMVPLGQRHNCKWKKILWSEYAGVVQIFGMTKEQLMLDMQDFLEPAETDVSLLKCYRRTLVSGAVRKHSVFYEIANYHVECFVKKERERKNKV